MKLCILVAYKFLIKNLNFGVNRCISGHVILQNMEFIRLAISQPFLKIEHFWFGPKNSPLPLTSDDLYREKTTSQN